jgi:hypothetical protein
VSGLPARNSVELRFADKSAFLETDPANFLERDLDFGGVSPGQISESGVKRQLDAEQSNFR